MHFTQWVYVTKPEKTYMWLMKNGGPVISYRTATELITQDNTLDIKQLQDDLLKK